MRVVCYMLRVLYVACCAFYVAWLLPHAQLTVDHCAARLGARRLEGGRASRVRRDARALSRPRTRAGHAAARARKSLAAAGTPSASQPAHVCAGTCARVTAQSCTGEGPGGDEPVGVQDDSDRGSPCSGRSSAVRAACARVHLCAHDSCKCTCAEHACAHVCGCTHEHARTCARTQTCGAMRVQLHNNSDSGDAASGVVLVGGCALNVKLNEELQARQDRPGRARDVHHGAAAELP